MRSSIGLFLIFASFVAVGCAGATEEENTDSTSSAMIGDPWRDPSWKALPPPPPVVFQSISGYAGFYDMVGHSNGPSQSTFVRPTHLSSNGVGTTWVIDEDPNDYWLGYVRIIRDTRGGVPGQHVQTAFSLYDIGFGPWNLGGLVVAENGTDAFVSDVWSHAIYKVSIAQPRTQFAGGFITWRGQFPGRFVDGPATSARFLSPSGLARDAAGNVYVADTGNHAVRKIDPNGNVSTVAANGSMSPPFDPKTLAVAPNGTIYAVSRQAVYRVTQNQISLLAGSPSASGFANGPGTTALFNEPKGITVDRLGDVYVADSANHCIRKISVAIADVSTIQQLPGFGYYPRGWFDTYGPDEGTLESPWGVAFWGDRLVFSDADRPTVRTMNPTMPQ